MKTKVPTLSINGWLESPDLRMNKLFEHFLASEYSQSNFHHGSVASLKYLLATTKVIADLKSNAESMLRELYRNYFDKVSIIVDVTDDDTSGVILMKFIIEATEGNDTYTLQRSVEGKLGNIANFYNKLDELYKLY